MAEQKNPHIGSLFEDWLKEEGLYEEVTKASIKRVLARQKRYEKDLTPAELAALTDDQFDTSDIPELDDAFWNNAILSQKAGK